jgi:hypothetical protein
MSGVFLVELSWRSRSLTKSTVESMSLIEGGINSAGKVSGISLPFKADSGHQYDVHVRAI